MQSLIGSSRVWWWSSLLATALPAIGQPVEVTRYDVGDGLPQSMVNHVLQDHDGFIWLGTGDGLARFDGARFVVYKHDPGDHSSISHNSIWGIGQADRHHLYVGTRTGADLLDTRSGEFVRMATGAQGHDGCWQPKWVSKDSALFYSPLTAETLVRTANSYKRRRTGHDPSYCMRTSVDGRSVHAFVFPDTLLSFDPWTGMESLRPVPNSTQDRVLDMIRLDNSWLVLAEHSAWQWMDDGTVRDLPADLRALTKQEPGGKCVGRDAAGHLWIGISGVGVAVLRPDLSVEHVYQLLPEDEGPLRITSLFFDKQGNTWVGTDGKGVFRIAPQRIKFGRAMPGQVRGWRPASWFVRGFAQWDAHHVLVSFHQGGLALYYERSLTLAPLHLPTLRAEGTYSQVLRDADGIIWTIEGTTLLAMDAATQRILLREDEPQGRRLLLDREDRLLVITPRGVQRYRLHEGSALREDLPFLMFDAWLDSVRNAPEAAAMDPLGRLWTSSPVTPVIVWPAGAGTARAQPFADDVRLNQLVDNGDGTGWVSTNDGLYSIRWRDLHIHRQLLPNDGLPDRFVYGMVDDGAGHRWISSNHGLSRAATALDTFRNYTTADGLQSMEFNSRALFRSASGRLYFGGINGFNHFLPTGVVDDPDVPAVAIVRAWAQDSLLTLGSGDPALELPYPRNRLELEIAVLEMSAPERAFFRYRMVGFQDDWRTASPLRPLVLERIPDGSFILEVQGLNADGVAGPVSRLLSIVVPLPFWSSTWFSVLLGCSLAAGIGLLAFIGYRRRKNAALVRVEREIKDLRMRTQLAKDIHDDVGSGLARMAALSRSPKRNTDTEARFEKLGDISGELLENLRDVVWLNDPRNGTLDALLMRVRDHANDLFDDAGTTVVCDFPDPIPTHTIEGAFRRNMFLIAKEALHNARKYSGAQRMVLRWREEPGGFTFEISDDGRGITSTVPQGSGHGTTNMRQRAQEMNATYESVPTPGGGTTVRVHGRSLYLDERNENDQGEHR